METIGRLHGGSHPESACQHLKNDLAEIYQALAREAKGGSFQHIKLALEVTGEHVDRHEVTGGLQIKVIEGPRDVR